MFCILELKNVPELVARNILFEVYACTWIAMLHGHYQLDGYKQLAVCID